ncbi:hypothetical protein QBC31_40090 [Streptomyces sp. B21-079]|uniref:hypothetical protein n=1 Tax=Streptomyces sp. B21-079 TaxID=3039409 RepID=UPI00070C5E90|nr:hypothetical protein ASE41_10860 [Streptomyces sp. Root264]
MTVSRTAVERSVWCGDVATGDIVAADRSWFFTLYFDATGTELVACSGVKSERPSQDGGQQLQL